MIITLHITFMMILITMLILLKMMMIIIVRIIIPICFRIIGQISCFVCGYSHLFVHLVMYLGLLRRHVYNNCLRYNNIIHETIDDYIAAMKVP